MQLRASQAILVSDRFWASANGVERDLRTILSQVSERPKECVFSDDPTVEDLWEVTGVTIADTPSGKVTFSYGGMPMAVLSFDFTADAKEVICRSLECEETRPLVLPGQTTQRWLFNFALAKIFDALPN